MIGILHEVFKLSYCIQFTRISELVYNHCYDYQVQDFLFLSFFTYIYNFFLENLRCRTGTYPSIPLVNKRWGVELLAKEN
jgi:hypothetical protein